MADFHQGGPVATLHNLTRRPLAELEAELVEFSKKRAMGLLLPSLFSELETEAMPKILAEVKQVPYLDQIVIGLDRADEGQYREALKFFGDLPQHHRVLWNDGPRLRALDEKLQQQGLVPEDEGKGRNVWYSLGYMFATDKAEAIALHDCDIMTYDRSLLARLIYPMANPHFSYQFAKGFYPRIADGSLGGRVTRLLIAPLIRSLEQVAGRSEYLSYLDGFRYPLAGEFSFRKGIIPDIRMPSDWGLEMGMLSEMFRTYSSSKLCQVDIAETYDHKHQDVSFHDCSKGLSRMSIDICKLVFRKLAEMGVVFGPEIFRSLEMTYYRNAQELLQQYRNDAIFNGLMFDVELEEKTIKHFAGNINVAGELVLKAPLEQPYFSSWARVKSVFPNVLEELCEAVEEDHRDFS